VLEQGELAASYRLDGVAARRATSVSWA
jgi:hypothetical protein